MNRGDLYRVFKASKQDPKKYRVFVVVSRQVLIDSKYSTVIGAPKAYRTKNVKNQ